MPTTVRADPGLGIFETMLVLDGAPVAFEGHLGRLGDSLGRLYATALPDGVRELVGERTAGLRLGRVRLSAVPTCEGIEVEVLADPVPAELLFPPAERGPELRSLLLPGGLGAHKWIDRSLLPTTEEADTHLLLDASGEALEAARANLFVVRGGSLSTPPVDGRILPGITRAAVLELAAGLGIEVSERPLSVRDLREADAVLLTGSVRGVEFARSLDGRSLAAATEVAEPLRRALRAHWAEEPRARTSEGSTP